ncbi:MAG TPA: PQQ-binding-like beta-propeller repeat protein, partial [Longimicrobiales bacterium]|nr:PQQ-binding-like beta-propeller repeat protein [Longimicrobiales bacterium]
MAACACSSPTAGPDRDALRVEWRVPLPGGSYPGPPAPALAGGHFFAVAGGITARRATDGSQVWHARGSDWVYGPANLIASAGFVFAAESLVYALDGGTGQERWRFTPVTNASIGKSAVDDRAFYFGTGTTARRIYALNRADGGVLWSTEIGPEWEFRGWVRGTAVSGDTVYATAEQYRAENGYRSSGWLVALDRFTGRIFWRYTLGAGEDARNLTSSPVIVGRLILASDYKGNAVIAVDRFTGQLVWETAGEAGYAGPADSPVVVGDTAYVGSGDTHVYALDVASGKILWRARTEASV